MPKKKFVLRIEESTMKVVERWANDEFRSVNGQLEWMITKILRDAGRLKPNPPEEPDENEEQTNDLTPDRT